MSIFKGISSEDLHKLTNCLQAVKKTFQKGEMIFDTNTELTSVCYILSGNVQLIKDDYEANKIIIGHLSIGETFGESFVCSGLNNSKIFAVAQTDTQILFLNFKRILSVCTNSCPFHKKLIENIIKAIATKNIYLQDRIELLSKKTLRDKILYLLNNFAPNNGYIFEIPYSREQMADYIGADRSAVSRELAKMKASGIIDYHKNVFKLLN